MGKRQQAHRELEHALAALGDWHEDKDGGPVFVLKQMTRRPTHDRNAARAFKLASYITSEHLCIDTPKEQTAAMHQLAPVLLELIEQRGDRIASLWSRLLPNAMTDAQMAAMGAMKAQITREVPPLAFPVDLGVPRRLRR